MSKQMSVETAIRDANTALSDGRLEDARKQMGAASLARIPEQCLRAAQLYLHLDEPGLAAQEARRAVDEDPRLAAGWSVLGYALLRQDKAVEAEQALRRSLELDPGLPQPNASLGALAAKRGDYRAAAGFFVRSLKLDPDQPQVVRLKKAAEVCASIPAGALPPGDLERLLLFAAEAGFPPCVREWIGRCSWEGREREMTEAYTRAEATALTKAGNNP